MSLDLSAYRVTYDPEYWRNVAEKVNNHCSSPFGAVLAVNALCDEIERLHAIEAAAVKVYELPVWAGDEFTDLMYELGKALRGDV